MDADEVATVPGSVPVCCPSSHCVTTGTSASAYPNQAAGSFERETGTLRPVSISKGHMRSGRKKERGTAANERTQSEESAPPP